LRIAIVNLEPYDQLEKTLKYIQNIHDNVIGAQIDLFCDDKVALDERLQNNPLFKNIYPQKLDNLSLFNFRAKYKSLRYYTKINRYHISIDTQNTLLSAFVTYILAGNTGGIIENNFDGYIKKKFFYDEYVEITNKEESIYSLFSNVFGFENEFAIES